MLNVRHSIAALVAAFGTAAAAGAQQAGPAAPDTVIHAGRLIDGTSTTVHQRVSILVAGDVRVERGFVTPPGGKIVDLTSATVLPGLIDSHTHITGEGTADAIVRAVTQGPVDAVRATVHAKRTLEAGFTTIRNVGADGGADVADGAPLSRRSAPEVDAREGRVE